MFLNARGFLRSEGKEMNTIYKMCEFQVDSMIRQCFQTLCKEWMSECHWFCDSVKEQNNLRRCKDCLSWRGQQCMDCFEL
ncbi:unnamed protein product [Heligmosomoides polygyrus]|uniref:Uncharacterized protein n=1 Tax=Heligmosomoides polygyrus TaxID=6339 RepID=A0A183GVV1_HELPZ|nr:unnamed protein product [Heligmosomoides polygyrus]